MHHVSKNWECVFDFQYKAAIGQCEENHQKNLSMICKYVHAYTVNENQCYTPRLMVFRFVLLDHLPVEKVPQMIYHLKALTQSFQNL